MSEGAGLYIHVPFCSAVCPYCDFAVQVGRAEARAAYVDALVREIALCSDWGAPIDTVYFGGGTPSLLSTAQIRAVLDAARAHLPVAGDARIHFEANPEDVSADNVRQWRALGVEFLSLGVQSFDARELRFLGRRHSADDAIRAVETCLAAGIHTVSVDLIFGLPGQSPSDWSSNLQRAMALGPQHISCYQLTLHEGTTFKRWQSRGKLEEMPEDAQAELFELTHATLACGGYAAYEVSNFARAPAHHSRHNQKYWRHVPYLGLGLSAHSFDGRRRWCNLRGLAAYTGTLTSGRRPIDGSETLSDDELALEALMLGLRTAEGIELDAYTRRFGIDLVAVNRVVIDSLAANDLLRIDDGRLRPTVRGLAVADGLAARLQHHDSSPAPRSIQQSLAG